MDRHLQQRLALVQTTSTSTIKTSNKGPEMLNAPDVLALHELGIFANFAIEYFRSRHQARLGLLEQAIAALMALADVVRFI